MDTPVLLTIGKTQDLTGFGRSTIYRLIRDGQLTSVKVGRSRRVVAESVAALTARLLAEQQS